MIVFRVDGNPQIATGHIMRCLSLADAFNEIGQEVVFVSADDCAKGMIEQRGYLCVVLHTQYDCLEDELPVLIPRLRMLCPHCVLLDSYFVTPGYMAAIKREVPLVYIDDLNMFDYPADLVVNYMLYANQFLYPQGKRYLLGPQYAPLRKEFQGVPKRTEFGPVWNVLISAGGGDPEHVALECVKYLQEYKRASDVTYHVVLGTMNRDTTIIERLAEGQKQIVLHKRVTDMRSLMLQCDAAISAGGTTLFELCACGLPTVTYVLADNQIMNAASFVEAGLMVSAGDVRKDDTYVKRIFLELENLSKSAAARRQMAANMQKMIDGSGAKRLAAAIVDRFV